MKKVTLNTLAFLLLYIGAITGISSCGTTGNEPCKKCIENKPAATAYSTQLNSIQHNLSLDSAVRWIQRFESARPNMGGNNMLLHETFNLKAIDSIICQEDAIGFRVYLSLNESNKVSLVLVGVDSDGKDVIQRKIANPGFSLRSFGGSIYIAETGQRYP